MRKNLERGGCVLRCGAWFSSGKGVVELVSQLGEEGWTVPLHLRGSAWKKNRKKTPTKVERTGIQVWQLQDPKLKSSWHSVAPLAPSQTSTSECLVSGHGLPSQTLLRWGYLCPELARDYLHRSGKYTVEKGIISCVHDAYGKQVSIHRSVDLYCIDHISLP